MMKHFTQRAFSMIEMLVVITILMVLAAVMVPTYAAVKKRALSVSCMNNLRQIGTGTMLYASEHGHFPHSSNMRLWCDWGELLIPYMDQLTHNNRWVPGESWACGLYKLNDGSFQHLAGEYGQGTKNPTTGQIYAPGYSWFTCPSGPPSKQVATYQGNTGVHVYSHNYACNEYLMPYGQWANSPVNYASEAAAVTAYQTGAYIPFPPVKPAELERPGSLILISDSGAGADGEASDTLFGPMYDATQGMVNGFVSDPSLESTKGATALVTNSDNDVGGALGWPVYSRHQGKCNALMADGHVQAFGNGEIQRRNFVSRGKTKRWGGAVGFVDAYYP